MRFFNKNIHFFILLLALLAAVKHVFILHDLFNFTWNIAINDAVCNLLVISLSVWSIMLLIKAYPTKVTLYSYSILIAFAFAFLSTFSEVQLLNWIVKKDTNSTNYFIWLRSTLPIRFIIIWIFYSWMSTNAALRKNMQALNSRFLQHNDAAELLKEAELFKLRQQLQPHFLYNSLNSINALVMISPDKAQEMIGKLSDFLRGSVKREGEDIISVNEEIVYIESYLAIESVRFGDRLSVSFEKDYSEKATIPPFLFQPILENAIKFGLYGKTGKVQISINIKEEDNTLMLTITNPYDINYMPPKGTGFGLKGVGRRLYLLYARTDLLETSNDGQNFTTILKIPQNHV